MAPSPFADTNAVTAACERNPDMQDILNLDGFGVEDRTLLQSFYENPESYTGRAIYLSNTGSTAIGDFGQEENTTATKTALGSRCLH